MSSALAMVLMAAMVVPGNGPEKVSAEITVSLHLDGEWEGTFYTSSGKSMAVWLFFVGGKFKSGSIVLLEGTIHDEGEGRFRRQDGLFELLGIYKQEGDHLVICYREAAEGRPTSFRRGIGQYLLILHRVKSRK